jgi:hypothetical protein
MIPNTVVEALTLVQQRQYAAATLKERVCQLLQWNEQQYAEFQYEAGLEYMQLYTLDDKVACNVLERSKIFWNWWKNAWANRDEVFFGYQNLGLINASTIEKMYMQLHDALALAEELRPDALVLGDSYKKMIGVVIKKEVENE